MQKSALGHPMLQILKGAARKAKTSDTSANTPANTDEDTQASKKRGRPCIGAGSSKEPSQKNTVLENLVLKRARKTRAPVAPHEMEVSITISVGSVDIPRELLGKMEEFLEKYCISGLCSIERGSSMSHLHLQMVCRLLSSSATMISKKIKEHLEWNDPKKAPPGQHILTKTLRNSGLHTFVGMLGYCIKDKGEDHFECVHKNISDAELQDGVEEYIKHGTPFAKNRVVLTHTNLIERAATYCKYKLHKQLGSTLPGTLLPTLQSGQYIPSASWILPVHQGGMEFTRASALKKCMMNPQAVEMSDVTQIFFEHTNPGSRLADLGRQQLAANSNEAREGADHGYNILDDGSPIREPNHVIDLHKSPDDPLPDHDILEMGAEHTLVTRCPTMYIPVVYGDRDVANDLTV